MGQTLIYFIHISSLVCWIGGIVFFSFFTAPSIFKTLDREKAGEVVGAVFPKYYALGYVCGGLAMVTLFLGQLPQTSLKLAFVSIMLVFSLFAGFGINPRARDLKIKIRSATDREREELQAKFKSLHSLSVQLNAGVLLVGLVLLWFTAESMVR